MKIVSIKHTPDCVQLIADNGDTLDLSYKHWQVFMHVKKALPLPFEVHVKDHYVNNGPVTITNIK